MICGAGLVHQDHSRSGEIMKNNKIKKIVLLSLLTALALIIFTIESAIPPIVPIQGVKLGLANVITLFLVLNADNRSAFAVLIVRVILAAIFAGQAISMIYSLCGGLLALGAMCAANYLLKGKPVWFISTAGAVSHNVGQIGAAVLMLSWQVIYYLPYLLISGCITGVLIGLLTGFTTSKMEKSGILKKFTDVFYYKQLEKENNHDL